MRLRKPSWLKIKVSGGKEYVKIKDIVEKNNLHTICSSGKCPNIGECWSKGAATFMIAGDICTRSCKFCATETGKPLPLDENEPFAIANSVKLMSLRHTVITSVDRDDLADGGANHWAKTILEIRKVAPETIIEVLIPDFDAKPELIKIVVDASPDIISHNIETARRLTPQVRSRAKYDVSLKTLSIIAQSGIMTKSGIMVGIGETKEEIEETMVDLYNAGCRMLTIGQYLQPTKEKLEVDRYVHPDEFEQYKKFGIKLGYKQVESGPLVRSSYMAEHSFSNILKT
ncbi:MAG: lipoyl synthase [Bacteroidales bacterium]|nr:lipoyl synthase [Bacteroidales bacterium]MDY0216122.1 lipoyl synthase [Bacteroidales bacterium]